MKVYVTEQEVYPVYSVHKSDKSYGEEIDIPEEKYQEWMEARRNFWKAQEEIEYAMQVQALGKEEMESLRQSFAKENPSRTEKGYILQKMGWSQIDTSLWEKDGREVRLHLAYEECKNNFLALNKESHP